MFESRAIHDKNDEFELCGLISEKTGNVIMPWIEFLTIKNKEYPDQNLCWDNDDYIFGKFYKFLKRWKRKELKKKDKKEFEDIWHILNDQTVEELIEMIEYALKKGWYEPKTN